MNILVTGGVGYIGSHTVRALQQAGYTPIIVDNLSRGHVESIPEGVKFYNMDIADPKLVGIMKEHNILGVMHFAAHSQVGESMQNPAIYYENNVVGSYHLIESARTAGIKHFVFSSTAAVYGEPKVVPIREDAQLQPTNVYGRTKLMIEEMMSDYSSIYGSTYVALRYFNAAGADPSGMIGEDHHPETHLIPLVLDAARGKREHITVFGTDYDTADGTCVRDYIHVVDLAEGHVAAMKAKGHVPGVHLLNLGSGRAYSVLEIVRAFEAASGLTIPYQIKPRREGDLACVYADPAYTKQQTGWKTKRDLTQMMEDAWRWVKNNPNGYED